MRRFCVIGITILMATLLLGCQSDSNKITTTTATATGVVGTTTGTSEAIVTTDPPANPITSAPITTDKLPSTQLPPTTEPDPPTPPAPEGTGLLTSLVLSTTDNPRLAKDLSFSINEEERTATLKLDYQTYADLATLSSARLIGQAQGGSVTILPSTVDGCVNLMNQPICIVTDENGWVKSYQLIVDRKVYQLPIVNINLADGVAVDAIDRELTTPMTFSLDCTGAEEYESIGAVSGTIRGRGNSTWLWDKKPYKIKLDKKASLLGLDDNKDWILLANYADKSLIRNTLAYELGRVLDHITWSPHSYPVDLFVNGEYRGVYALGEHMEVANGRVDIEEGSTDPDTDYLLEIGGMNMTGDVNGVHYFHTDGRLVRFATFKSPDFEEITEAQKAFITDYFQKAEDAIKKGEGYEKYIDVDSFVDWIILHELSYNVDSCFRRSCFLTKEKGGKIRMGPIWDFDLAFGNFSRDNKKYDNWVTVGSDEKDAYVQYNWCTYLLRDKEFCQRLAERWEEVRDELLTVANDTIDSYGALLDGSQQENFKVWDIWNISAGYQAKWCATANTYEKQLQYLRDFLSKRAKWMDDAIPKLPTN
ncbi:MAG: CotH kinase family protein [Clostridia bacterium]|nr:CotH kinase family protein [Clostridia bacterium]